MRLLCTALAAVAVPQSIVQCAGAPDLSLRRGATIIRRDGVSMRGVLRFLAGVMLVIAVLAAVYDGTRSIAADRLVTTALIEQWSTLAPTLLAAARNAVVRYSHPLVWELGVRKFLLLPTWLVFAMFGLVLGYAGRRRRQVNVFAN
jgi:hypothetical protein